MKAMILAAGRGQRMRPLTDAMPKPLLKVGGKALIAWQVERLVAAGFTDLVVNHAWLGAQIETALGDGSTFGARIAWSREDPALETAGGIVNALPLLESDARDRPFAVVSADVYTTFDYRRLVPAIDAIALGPRHRAVHLVAVDNPPYHPRGDFALVDRDGVSSIARDGPVRSTYANIGVFHPRVFDGLATDRPMKLFPWAFGFADDGRMTGERCDDAWFNVGTPDDLATLDRELARGRRVDVEA